MKPVKRRSFLKGVALGAGAATVGPMLRQLRARADGLPGPKRLVIVMEGDCLHSRRFTPPETLAKLDEIRKASGINTQTKPYWEHYSNATPLNISAPTLQTGFSPLAPYADHLVLVQGLSNRAAGGVSSHSADFGALSCSNSSRTLPVAPTIDRVLGSRLGQGRAFPSLALGASGRPDRTVEYAASAYARDKPAPVYVNPQHSHNMLFGTVSGQIDPKQEQARDQLMDAIGEDLARVRSQLAGPERETFDTYVDSIETLRNRRSKLLALEPSLRANAPDVGDMYSSPHLLLRLEAQFELAAAAMTTGLTDIVLLASGCGNAGFNVNYTSLHNEIPGKHTFGHGESFEGQHSGYWLSEVHRRHCLLIDGLIKRLKNVPEGDGTMWDNTIVVYTSDGGASHHDSFYDWPLVLLAGSNTPILTESGGRSLVYPKHGTDRHRHISNFWNTIAHAMGTPIDDFGVEGNLRIAEGPLPELL